MKKLAIILVSVLIAVVCALLLWQQVKISRDRDFCQKVLGTWSWESSSMQFTNIISPNGSFTGQEFYDHLKSTNTYQIAGTWRIKNGDYIQTITSDSNPDAKRPPTHSGRIIRVDAHEFVVVWHGDTNKIIWQRVTQ